MVLADKAKYQRIILVDDLNLPEAKTKKLKEVLDKLPVKDNSSLIVLDKKNENIIKSAKNLQKILTENYQALNVVDLLKYEYLLLPVKVVNSIVKHFSK